MIKVSDLVFLHDFVCAVCTCLAPWILSAWLCVCCMYMFGSMNSFCMTLCVLYVHVWLHEFFLHDFVCAVCTCLAPWILSAWLCVCCMYMFGSMNSFQQVSTAEKEDNRIELVACGVQGHVIEFMDFYKVLFIVHHSRDFIQWLYLQDVACGKPARRRYCM